MGKIFENDVLILADLVKPTMENIMFWMVVTTVAVVIAGVLS